MRAASHQRNWDQLRGLREWARLRIPHNYNPPVPPPATVTVRETVEVIIATPGRFVRAVFGRRIF